MAKNEIRKHYFQDKYVIIAPGRSKRPHTAKIETKHDDSCQCFFCPNNKEKAVYEIRGDKGWLIKVLNNKFPALTLDNKYAYGKQEIIIETPEHDKEIHELPLNHIKKVLDVYSERHESLSALKKIRYVLVFKNEGGKAGASVPHSHSQVIALPMMPPLIREEIYAIEKYYMDTGRCPYCDIIKSEKSSPRAIWEDKHMFALSPYASESPYGVWIIPKRHVRKIHDMTEEEKRSLAEVLKFVLTRLASLDISYNYFFHNSTEEENHHMILKVAPRPNIWAGLELGTGIIINSISPEAAAKFYRN